MKKEVILLDTNKELSKKIKNELSSNFSFYDVPNLFDIKNLFREYDVEALVADSSRFPDALNLMRKNFPNVPTLVFDKRKSTITGREHQKQISFEADSQDIEKTLNYIINKGDKNRKKEIQSEILKLQDKWNQHLSFSIEDHMNFSFELLSKYTRAENVIWLEKEKIEYYLHEMWKVQTLNSPILDRGRGEGRRTIYSHKGASPSDLTKLCQTFIKSLGQEWLNKKNISFSEGHIVFPVTLKDKVSGYFIATKAQNFDYYIVAKVLEGLSTYLGMRYEMAKNYSKVKDMSYIDDLTDLYNQRFLGKALDKCIKQYEENGECFSVLFMDIDHFKKVNDNQGHIVGSRVLVELGKILKQNIRNIDYGFRYGGDEYLLVLTNTDPQLAENIAERIREQVENTVFDVCGQKLQITLSIGIASFPMHAKNKQEVLEMADQAMYYGKNKSRNIVYVAS